MIDLQNLPVPSGATGLVATDNAHLAVQQSGLSVSPSSRLQELEAVIHSAGKGLLAAGEALAEIKKGKLYRARFNTFDQYCHVTFGFSQQYANRLIKAWHTYKHEKNSYNLRHQGADFEVFPLTAEFWRQSSQVPEGRDRDEVLGRCWELKRSQHRELRARDVREIWQQLQDEIHSTNPDDDEADEGGEDSERSEIDAETVPVDIPGIVAAIRDGAEITEMLSLDEATRATLGAELGKTLLVVREEEKRLVAAMKTLGVPIPALEKKLNLWQKIKVLAS